MAPPQQRPPDDGQVMQRPLVVLRSFIQVGGGFGGGVLVDRRQHPHAQTRQKLRPLSVEQEGQRREPRVFMSNHINHTHTLVTC